MGSNAAAVSKTEFKQYLTPFLTWCEGRFPYVFHVHFASVLHGDLRMAYCGDPKEMIGVTLFIYKAGSVKDRPEGVKEWSKFVKIVNQPSNFKLNFKTGEIVGQRSLQATVKLPEPIEWMKVKKYISPPGRIGARYLKKHWGYMVIVDRGLVEHLTRKLDEFEFYFSGGKTFRGRYILRPFGKNFNFFSASADEVNPVIVGTSVKNLREGKELGGFLWIKTKNQTPYVLSRRAIQKKFISPKNFSALPQLLKKRIPRKFQYWRHEQLEKRLSVRDELVTELKRQKLLQPLVEGKWEKIRIK